MSKQYLTLHTHDTAHPTDIFALAPRKSQILSASGSPSILIHSTTDSDFPIQQTLENAHPLGTHHLVTAKEAPKAASAGFDGKVKIWSAGADEVWKFEADVVDNVKPGEVWAIALSADGLYLASTSITGKINIWSLAEPNMPKIREYETKGSFGLCIDLSADGSHTASGHQNGSIHLFSNTTGRLTHSLAGLVTPTRTLSFSPTSKLLAAAGDSRIIAIYAVSSGEQVANFTGHGAWILSLDWSDTGEYLLSGAHDGKAKVWSMESRQCVATHGLGGRPVWAARWLGRVKLGGSEMFALAGGGGVMGFYREAAG